MMLLMGFVCGFFTAVTLIKWLNGRLITQGYLDAAEQISMDIASTNEGVTFAHAFLYSNATAETPVGCYKPNEKNMKFKFYKPFKTFWENC